MTRRPRDPEATREAILEAACTLLSKRGPDGISLSEVAQLAGRGFNMGDDIFAARPGKIGARDTRRGGEGGGMGFLAGAAMTVPDRT